MHIGESRLSTNYTKYPRLIVLELSKDYVKQITRTLVLNIILSPNTETASFIFDFYKK